MTQIFVSLDGNIKKEKIKYILRYNKSQAIKEAKMYEHEHLKL